MKALLFIRKIVFLSTALLLGVHPLGAQDPSIKNWGSPPGTPPPWQTADIWVDNNGNGTDNVAGRNEVGEPSLRIVNHLFAQIRNLGPIAVKGDIVVKFAFAPYGLWTAGSLADFKQIGDPVLVHGLGAAAETTVGIDWDLSDLGEKNGGKWNNHTLGEFDHFCVLVTLTSAEDVNPSNNIAQNNFTNVPISVGSEASVKFMIANPKNQNAVAEVLVAGLPENWRFRLEGAEQGRFVLKPREFRVAVLHFTPVRTHARPVTVAAPDLAAEGLASAHVDVSLRLDGEIAGGLSFDAKEPGAAAAPVFPPSGGSLSPYLIGTYDLSARRRTTFQIVNPTGKPLRVLVAFFDDDEKPLACVRERLSANDLLEIDASRHVQAPSGVVKIVSFEEGGERPAPGVVGYQRTFNKTFFFGYRLGGETILQAIPAEILAGDLWMIRRACP